MSSSFIRVPALYSLGLQDARSENDILVHAFAVNHGVNAEFPASVPGIRPRADPARNRRGNGRWMWRIVSFSQHSAGFPTCRRSSRRVFSLAARRQASFGRAACTLRFVRNKGLVERLFNGLTGGARTAAIFDLAVRVEAFVGLRRCVRGDSKPQEGEGRAQYFHGGRDGHGVRKGFRRAVSVAQLQLLTRHDGKWHTREVDCSGGRVEAPRQLRVRIQVRTANYQGETQGLR